MSSGNAKPAHGPMSADRANGANAVITASQDQTAFFLQVQDFGWRILA
jgi:hypothetical protein